MGNIWGRKRENVIITSIEARLKNITREHLTDFSFENIETVAKVVSVYDGDSCRIAFGYPPNDNNAEIIMVPCVLNKIVAPKIKTKNHCEKENGYRSKRHLTELVMNNEQLVYVKFNDADLFKRPFIDIYINKESMGNFNLSVNNRMVIENHASFYSESQELSSI